MFHKFFFFKFLDVSEENKISKIKGKFFFLNFLRDSEFDHKTIENIHFLLNNFFRFPYKIQSWLLSRNGPKFEKKNRQIEGETSKVSRICDFLVNFDWSKFKSRKKSSN